MIKALVFIFFLISASFLCKAAEKFNFEIRKVISSADICRALFTEEASINLYQGNGLFGCSYGVLGLHNRPDKELTQGKFGHTQFMHLEHRGRGKFGADYLLPLAKIFWENDFSKISDYNQSQSFYNGTITTSFNSSGNNVKVITWFDPVEKSIAGISIRVSEKSPNVLLDPLRELKVHYDQNVTQAVSYNENSGVWKVDIIGLDNTTTLFLKTNATVQLTNNVLSLKLSQGDNEILISANTPTQTTLKNSLNQTIKWWNKKWEESGCIKYPDPNAQKMWVRSMAMFFSSFGDDKKGLAPSMGLTGNGWPFSFPQDLSYVQPMLLSTGNIPIAKSMIEYFSERLQGMKDYTRRLINSDGIFCPWLFPYGKFEGYHDPSPPNIYYYEIHNSGYLSRMASETAIFVNDSVWSSKYAIPLIKETAKFYKSICKKESDGLWHLFVKPSMGQDEMGGADQKDYLCALYSAQYCFKQAIAHKLDVEGIYAAILRDGLAFNTLLSEKGCYFSCYGSGEKDFGTQKHPVQLNELAYLPVNNAPSKPASIAYMQRYEITINSKRPYFTGWTLGEFLLAGSRYGNSKEWLKDWDNLLKSGNIDPDWIQVYETCGNYKASYYNATNGLIAQSLLNNVVSDWYGKLQIARCFPWKGEVWIKNIYLLLGVKINGKITQNSADLHLTAWKDCNFYMHERKVEMKKGQQSDFYFNITK